MSRNAVSHSFACASPDPFVVIVTSHAWFIASVRVFGSHTDRSKFSMAYAEMYLTLATVFRRFDMDLYETTRRHIDPHFDYFFPVPELPGRITVLVK